MLTLPASEIEEAVAGTLTAVGIETANAVQIQAGIEGTLTALADTSAEAQAGIPSESETPLPATETPNAADITNPPPQPDPITEVPPLTPPNPDVAYQLMSAEQFGNAIFRVFRPQTDNGFSEDFLTIQIPDQPLQQIENFTGYGSMTGQDLTADGYPEVVVEGFTGGAHCCFSTHVFSTAPTNTQEILALGPSQCGSGSFEDLDNDGVFEFLTCEDRFDYLYCPYAASPHPAVVLHYSAESGYQPASPDFAGRVLLDENVHLQLAQNAVVGEMGESDGTNKCAVLPIVLDYLYTGQTNLAWTMLDSYYIGTDKTEFQTAIADIVFNSPLYRP
ncbi:MAG TPA: hypothetical protein PK299_00220 [Anaerolineales bacterium]|nr:hypothetical protein [Anaerolineales bacterium]